LWFKLSKNKSVRKTILNIVFIYLSTTILLVISISFLYIKNQKEEIFNLHREQTNTQANYIISKLEDFDEAIVDEVVIYPRIDGLESAIYDIDYNMIFSTFKQKIVFKDKKYISKDEYIYFIYKVEPYYLGTAYLVIQKQKGYELKSKYKKMVFVVLFIILFLILTSFIIAKMLIKPLSDNLILLDRFIKDTTHELNTPISAILNNIELLNLDTIDKKNLKKINRIKIGATTISTIYDDLSFLLLNNKQKSNNQNINISQTLYQRLEYFDILATNKHIEFKKEIKDDIYLVIDKLKIERLFDNLISNAIKYSNVGSKIIITLDEIHFSIEDFGIGMYEDEVKEIFTRYKRFDKTNGGFGIGYSIIYNIIKEYNIKINIDSLKDKGTKVILKW